MLKREATGGEIPRGKESHNVKRGTTTPSCEKSNTNANSNKKVGMKHSYNTRNHENPWIPKQNAEKSLFSVFAQNQKQSKEIAKAAPTGAHE